MVPDTDRHPARLEVVELTKEFSTPEGPLVVLEQVTFTLEPGESLAVLGPSGSGKSTLLNIIGSLEPPTAGRVRLGDLEVTTLSGESLAAYRSRQVGFVFQEHHLLPQCTALENVQLPALAAGAPTGALHRARELLEHVSLADRAHHLPAQLSGGERQRVAVARALLHHPALLLCDEPTGNLDRATGDRVAALCLELATREQAMVILVTHDPRLARRCGQQRELANRRLRALEG